MTSGLLKQAALAVALVTVLLVSGCSTGGSLPMFGQPQENADKLPSAVKMDKIDGSTSRFLGADSEGVKYFVAETHPKGASEICLVVFPSDDGWAVGCGENLPVSVGIESGKQATLYSEPTPDSSRSADEWVGEYLSVKQ